MTVRALLVYVFAASAVLLWIARPAPRPVVAPTPENQPAPVVRRPARPPQENHPPAPHHSSAQSTSAPKPQAPAASTPVEPASPRSLNAAFLSVAEEFDLPPALLTAIARHESRANPWALHLDGRGHFPESREQAVKLLQNRTSDNFDVGIMQINSSWLKKFKITPAEALEPQTNIRLGAWVLKQCVDEHGMGWDALAAYHTGKPGKHNWRASVYALKVWRRYEKIKKSSP
jgi:soluble lytic murein transglycosylase-like protein